ncbi:5-(carboxyamino)imidazole ribonucleotide synthase [Melioribacteraceae bacterium 4301-Me]|uniref:5-(carboxyamino)imidazole ribonucleotide synthase n=1 Tax=Pyranulibacter aquaticus TaxID=3163344 RepID=UPI003599A0C7
MSKRTCIGILGGGQLARMSAFEAYKLGFEIAILEKIKNSPAGQLTHNEFVGWVDDEEVFNKFIQQSDIVTLENEFVDYQYLEHIERTGKKVLPSSKTIGTIQDKLFQKLAIRRNQIPVPNFIEIKKNYDYEMISTILGKKFILKSRKMGYDGYGNALITNDKTWKAAVERLTGRHNELMAEEFIEFQKELAVMVVRTSKEIKTYPVVETIQENHICKIVIAPADITKRIQEHAKEIAIEAVKAIKGYGIFGVELFLNRKDEVLLNELAPRPHNSGHYTLEACVTSQFENHIRAILDLPLGSTEMIKQAAVMINILGKQNSDGLIKNYNQVLKQPDIHLHFYNKETSRVGRKMGHITVIGNNKTELLKKAKQAERLIQV